MCCNLKKGQRKKSDKKGHAILTQFITLLLIHIDTLTVLYKIMHDKIEHVIQQIASKRLKN